MHLFSDYKSRWSKKPQWENDCGSFLLCFLLVMSAGTRMCMGPTMGLGFNLLIYGGARMATCPSTKPIRPACQLPNLPPINICLSEVKLTSFGAIPSLVAARLSILAHGQELSCRVGSCEDLILRCGAVSTLQWSALWGKWLHGRSGFANYYLALIVVFHILRKVGAARKSSV
jgi:hypothetical protein